MEVSGGLDGRGQPGVMLLVVRPHPDDESSATGGLLAYYHARRADWGGDLHGVRKVRSVTPP